jgi:hypothetical protein
MSKSECLDLAQSTPRSKFQGQTMLKYLRYTCSNSFSQECNEKEAIPSPSELLQSPHLCSGQPVKKGNGILKTKNKYIKTKF